MYRDWAFFYMLCKLVGNISVFFDYLYSLF